MQQTRTTGRDDDSDEAEVSHTTSQTKEKLAAADDLLDDIDDLLENNAEQFVKDYVQQGGQ